MGPDRGWIMPILMGSFVTNGAKIAVEDSQEGRQNGHCHDFGDLHEAHSSFNANGKVLGPGRREALVISRPSMSWQEACRSCGERFQDVALIPIGARSYGPSSRRRGARGSRRESPRLARPASMA